MVTNNVTVYQFEVGLDEVFADEVRFHVNVDCVIVVVVKDCLFFMSFILCENCEFVKWMCWMLAFLAIPGHHRYQQYLVTVTISYTWWWCRPHPVREHAQDLRPPLGARPASPPTRQAAQPPPRGSSTNPRPLV